MKKCRASLDPNLIRELVAAGCPMPSETLSLKPTPQDLTIEVSRPELTIAYDRRAGTEYVFAVRITNHSYAPLVQQRFRARTRWPGRLCFLGDPRIHMPERQVYRLESGREFPHNEVLNHRIHEQGTLNPGESFEGILLAYTMFDRIPSDYIHGETAFLRLSVADQYGRWHSSDIEVLIDRRATMPPRIFMARRIGGLFDNLTNDQTPAVSVRVPVANPTSAIQAQLQHNRKDPQGAGA